jgi:hypothetical protein
VTGSGWIHAQVSFRALATSPSRRPNKLEPLQDEQVLVGNLVMWVDVSVEQLLAIPKSNLKLTVKVLERLMDCGKIHKLKTAATERNNCLSRSGVRFPINSDLRRPVRLILEANTSFGE